MMRATKMLKSIFLSAWGGGKVTNLLTVVVALTLATVTPALAANGGNFLLGRTNAASAVTTLIKSGVGPALQLVVPAGQPPLIVNAKAGKATNLNADKLDGQDSSAFLPVNGTAANATNATNATNAANAANADTLDGKDSTALGVTMKTNTEQTSSCAAADTFSECAPVSVTVPTGKQYQVSVVSSFAISTPVAGNARYCPGIKGGSVAPAVACIGSGSTTNGLPDRIDLAANIGESGAGSGEIGPLPAGTYTFSTVINASTAVVGSNVFKAHTTVYVTDVSASGPPIT